MYKLIKVVIGIIFVSVFFIIYSGSSYSQWVSTGGPGGGRIESITEHMGKIYVGTNNGQVYKSSDNGDSWLNASDGLPSNQYDIIGLTGNNFGIYAISYSNGLYFSSNEGASWSIINIPQTPYIKSVFGSGNKLFAGTEFGDIFLSYDGGLSWNQANYGIQAGAIIKSFVSKDSFVYAGSDLGIYRTTNDGGNWIKTSAPLVSINAMYFKGDTLLAGYNYGVFYSGDNGNSWQYFNLNSQGSPIIYSLVSHGSTIIAGSFSGEYLSLNGGISWNYINTGNIENFFETFGLLYTGGRFLSCSNAGVYISSNGQDWNSSMYGLTSLIVNRLKSCGNDLYANLWGNGGGMQLSTNNGSNWISLNTNYQFNTVQYILPVDGRVFIASIDGVYMTTNRGTDWLPVNNGLNDPIVYTLAYNESKIYAGTQDHGIFMSTNHGDTWINISSSLPSQYVRAIAFSNNSIYAGTANGVYMSSDGGNTWESRNSGISYLSLDKLYSYRNTLYCTTQYGDLFRSTNGGLNWTELTNGLPTFKISLFFMRNYIFAGTDEGAYMSSDGGTIWTEINQGFPAHDLAVRVIVKDYVLYNAAYVGGVWKRPLYEVLPHYTVSGHINYADNFLPVNQGKVKALVYDENTCNVIAVDSAQIQSGGYYTLPHVPSDSTFIMAYPNDEFDFVPTYYPSTTDWKHATIIYPVGSMNNINISVYRIDNQSNPFHIAGIVYKTESNSYPLGNAVIYAKSGNYFRNFSISGNNGVYSVNSLAPGSYTITCNRIGFNEVNTTLNVTSISLEGVDFHLSNYLIGIEPPFPNVPQAYNLYQNYPNPFNPRTAIRYDIPQNSIVNLTVYDILGREVTKLISNEFKKAGRYKVEFNAANLASGIYIYRLKAGGYIETRKMVLVK